MEKALGAILLLASGFAWGQSQPTITVKSVLLAQLKGTHDVQEWFVPARKAVEGLTPEQAVWREGRDNHSIAQLVNHLVFWNKEHLAKFKGEKPAAYSGNNAETFVATVDKKTWDAAVQELDDVLTAWEKAIEGASDAKLQSWYSTIARINTHNAYHTGQILYIRKQQGSWDAAKGVQ